MSRVASCRIVSLTGGDQNDKDGGVGVGDGKGVNHTLLKLHCHYHHNSEKQAAMWTTLMFD